MFLVGLILGGILGGIIAVIIVSILMTADRKSNQEAEQYEVAENNLRKYYTRPLGDVKLYGFKDNLRIILKGDIDFYNKMYNVNKAPYYLGRIQQSKFILNIVEGRSGEHEK